MDFKEFVEHLSTLDVDNLSLKEAEQLEQLLAIKHAITVGQINKLKSRKD